MPFILILAVYVAELMGTIKPVENPSKPIKFTIQLTLLILAINFHGICFCLFEWTLSWREESGCLVISVFSSHSGAVVDGNAPFHFNPGNKINYLYGWFDPNTT